MTIYETNKTVQPFKLRFLPNSLLV